MRRYTLNKYTSRLVAVLLVVTMLTCAVPAALATEVTAPPEGTVPPEITEPAQVAYSGTCGENLTWSFSGGTLTISGSGAMSSYSQANPAPWNDFREDIIRLELPEGLTSVGNRAFYECKNLTSLVIPNSVITVGNFAFTYCNAVRTLTLGSNLRSVGESAFSDLVKLVALRLPDSLQRIGMKAFYRCESIATLTIPASVNRIDMMAFGYCKSLVSADVRANISVLPEWMFYGCKNLVTISLPENVEAINAHTFQDCPALATICYDGDNRTLEEIQQIMDTMVPASGGGFTVMDGDPSSINTAGSITDNGDGTNTMENTTVIEGDNSVTSSEILVTRPTDETEGGAYTGNITIIVDNEDGWDEARDALDDLIQDYEDTVSDNGGERGDVTLDIYIPEGNEINQEFVDALPDRNIDRITIITSGGSSWTLDSSNLEIGSGAYDLRFQVSAGDEALCAELEASACFRVKFQNTAQINAEVLIQIGAPYAMQNATLFQRQEGELIRRQSTVVDREGFTHFYLASVDSESEYYIAMNLKDAQQEALIPQELNAAYGSPVNVQPIQYEITGRTSSWGMTINQVTWIMIAFLGTTVIVVGVVMYTLNKRRLRMGYVPDLEDDYDE